MCCNMERMTDALDGAKMVGYNDDGHLCAWYGGYSFNVYAAQSDWREVDHFTSGELAAGDASDIEREMAARDRMKMADFEIVE